MHFHTPGFVSFYAVTFWTGPFSDRTIARYTESMENYKLAGLMETPEIEVIIDNMPERGVIGVGEPPRIPTAGALANAVYNAIGARVTRMPMTPDVVLEALANKGGA